MADIPEGGSRFTPGGEAPPFIQRQFSTFIGKNFPREDVLNEVPQSLCLVRKATPNAIRREYYALKPSSPDDPDFGSYAALNFGEGNLMTITVRGEETNIYELENEQKYATSNAEQNYFKAVKGGRFLEIFYNDETGEIDTIHYTLKDPLEELAEGDEITYNPALERIARMREEKLSEKPQESVTYSGVDYPLSNGSTFHITSTEGHFLITIKEGLKVISRIKIPERLPSRDVVINDLVDPDTLKDPINAPCKLDLWRNKNIMKTLGGEWEDEPQED
jgi:hypothetical protein